MSIFNYFIKKDKLDKIKLYIKNGGNPNAKNGMGQTLIHEVCWHGHLDIVSYLIEVGAKTEDISPCGNNLLHVSSCMRHTHITDYLLKNGYCNTEKRDKYGNTPLHDAAGRNYLEIVKLLLEYSPSTYNYVNQEDKTSLDLAVDFICEEVTEYLKNWMGSSTPKGRTIKAAR